MMMTQEELKKNVEKALDEIRPFLQSDGGNISLISIENGKLVKVQLEGACTNCSVNKKICASDRTGHQCRSIILTDLFKINFLLYAGIFF